MLSSSDGDHPDQAAPTPTPCGSSREFLAEFGVFDVYLVTPEGSYVKTTTRDLLPTFGRNNDGERSAGASSSLKIPPSEWTTTQVVEWVELVLAMPDYAPRFRTNAVNGAMLVQLDDDDLADLLGIDVPLHRRKILDAIHRTKDAATMEYGCNAKNLSNYLALMDADRVKQVAKLKEAFDKLDTNKNGELSYSEVQTAFQQLGHEASHDKVRAWTSSVSLRSKHGSNSIHTGTAAASR